MSTLRNLTLATSLFLISFTSQANEEAFVEIIKQPFFKIEPSQNNLKEMHKASTLVISCVDFRLRDETLKLMNNKLQLNDDYDEISLPGAALALVIDKYPHWGKTIQDIIALLIQLHGIKRIIFLNHRNCGAFSLIKGKEHATTKETETNSHKKVFDEARKKMKQDFPHLEIYTLLLDLDGIVENIH